MEESIRELFEAHRYWGHKDKGKEVDVKAEKQGEGEAQGGDWQRHRKTYGYEMLVWGHLRTVVLVEGQHLISRPFFPCER